MIFRHQPPVLSPVRASALASATLAAIRDDSRHSELEQELGALYGAPRVVLTDSGTSALVLALRHAAGVGGTVAFPGYGCIDLSAAACFAQVRVRLYDIDPLTLSPDLDSVERALSRGVDAIVVVHLFGIPADVASVERLAAAHGVTVIEDAAQGAGGTLHGRRLGSFGALTVLSFGRGKGITGGNGGALLVRESLIQRRNAGSNGQPAIRGDRARPGWSDIAGAAAQWSFARPSLYAVPSAIPALRLGEMVYRPAHEPAPLSTAAARLVCSALSHSSAELAQRQRHAATLDAAAAAAPGIDRVRPIPGSLPGFLRFPLVDRSGRRPAPTIGVMRGYPLTLAEQVQLRPCLHAGENGTAGARRLRADLFTLPTHSMVSPRDMMRLTRWLCDVNGEAV